MRKIRTVMGRMNRIRKHRFVPSSCPSCPSLLITPRLRTDPLQTATRVDRAPAPVLERGFMPADDYSDTAQARTLFIMRAGASLYEVYAAEVAATQRTYAGEGVTT